MNKQRKFLRLRASVLAVHGALGLIGMAHADDPTVADLTEPSKKIEVGIGATNSASAKAHEYDGVSRKGVYLLGSFELLGGGAYDSEDATRWRITGTDLGLQSRSLNGEFGVQGNFRLKFSYDELLRNSSDSFHTPYQGVGSNKLSLPSKWVVPVVPVVSATQPNARGLSPAVTGSNAIVGGVSTAPTGTQPAQAAALQVADLPLFQSVNLSTKREQLGLGGDFQIDSRWLVSISGSHEHKDGLKAFSALTRATTYQNGAATATSENSATLPQPIDQDHNQYRVAASHSGDGSTLQLAYDASLFTNNVSSVTWASWAGPTVLQSMGTAPSNEFHKLSLAGSYDVDSVTKLVGGLSYSRATQNETFLNDGLTTVPLLPATSLQGLVVSKTANLKLLSKPSKDLHLSAGYKFDERDNRTPVNTYGFYDVGELKSATGSSPFSAYLPLLAGGYGTNLNLNANRPYSKRVNQINLDADYRLQPGQKLHAGWDTQKTDKYCNGSWIDCSDAAKSTEHTARAELNLTASDDLSARVGVAHSRRTVKYNEDAFLSLVPYANFSPTGVPGGAGVTAYSTLVALGLAGYGPVAGLTPVAPAGSAQAFFFANNNALSNSLYGNVNRISELVGMRRYNNANRDRNKLRTSAQWQASETFTLQGGFDYNNDNYSESVYGLQKAASWALNLDGTYAASENFSVSVFYSHEDQRSTSAGNTYGNGNSTPTGAAATQTVSGGCFNGQTNLVRLNNSKTDPCLDWQSQTTDKVDTLGLTLNRSNLLGSKLDLSGSLIYSRLHSDQDVNGGNYQANPYAGSTAAGAVNPSVAVYFIPAAALPTVKTDSIELRLGGAYRFTKEQAVRVGYSYQHLKAVDWAYDGLQYGGLSGVLPTSEQAPSYSVRNIGVAYVVSFR
ncbi:MAG: MtrB/PioB family outer membrane beta-barrel protein [Leptothrix sp. (in: b-proteobacteria)]